jgi:hypothetical protein
MARRNQFTVDAESVQSIPGATVTFKAIKVREWEAYRTDPSMGLPDLLEAHVADWSGFTDDDGHELPSPKDEPGIVGDLYFHEMRELQRLLIGSDPN